MNASKREKIPTLIDLAPRLPGSVLSPGGPFGSPPQPAPRSLPA